MDGQHRISLTFAKSNHRKGSSALKGPLKVFRLCLLSILLPALLIAGPLYLRYRVFSEQVYPLGMSDMRLVDSKISTTWCQKQLVKSNATFSAYLLPEEPKIKPNPVSVSMVRYLTLEDDMKEYWGFYLLEGSSVTVSTCCRWPGTSLIVIKGHSHLRECAYIGDNSSEELQELKQLEKLNTEKKKEEPKRKTNSHSDVWPLKKARPSIEFHESHKYLPLTSSEMPKKTGEDESSLMETLTFTNNTSSNPRIQSKRTLISQHLSNTKNSEEVVDDIMSKIANGNQSFNVISRLRKMFKIGSWEKDQTPDSNRSNPTDALKSKSQKHDITLLSLKTELNKDDQHSDAAEEDDVSRLEEIHGRINNTMANDMSNSEFWSSFSSSEERLLSCAGLILNLPLTPSTSCHPSKSENTQAKASHINMFTYKVPSNGYYFFAFSSENEIQPNYIRIHFQLEKILYNVSNSIASCTNITDSCSLPLNFFSKEKVVLELPVKANETLWNQEYVVISVCEPRTILYAACVIAVPILILLFAF